MANYFAIAIVFVAVLHDVCAKSIKQKDWKFEISGQVKCEGNEPPLDSVVHVSLSSLCSGTLYNFYDKIKWTTKIPLTSNGHFKITPIRFDNIDCNKLRVYAKCPNGKIMDKTVDLKLTEIKLGYLELNEEHEEEKEEYDKGK